MSQQKQTSDVESACIAESEYVRVDDREKYRDPDVCDNCFEATGHISEIESSTDIIISRYGPKTVHRDAENVDEVLTNGRGKGGSKKYVVALRNMDPDEPEALDGGRSVDTHTDHVGGDPHGE